MQFFYCPAEGGVSLLILSAFSINVRKYFLLFQSLFLLSPLFLPFFLLFLPLPNPLLTVSFAPVTVDTTQADNRRCLGSPEAASPPLFLC